MDKDIGKLTACPRCGLEAKTLLHKFCTLEACPVREAEAAVTYTSQPQSQAKDDAEHHVSHTSGQEHPRDGRLQPAPEHTSRDATENSLQCVGLTPGRVEEIAKSYFGSDYGYVEHCIGAINKALREDRAEVERKALRSTAEQTNAAPQGGGGSQPVDCEHQEGYVAADSRQNSPTKIPAVLPAGAAPIALSSIERMYVEPHDFNEAKTRFLCDWPTGSFRLFDDPDQHKPCYLVCPDGASVGFCHHDREGVDKARVQFIVDACNAALFARSAREGQHWVSVSERLPDGDGPVIAYVGVETPAICFYDGHWYYWDSSGTSADVTHWMPVPKRPSSSTGATNK